MKIHGASHLLFLLAVFLVEPGYAHAELAKKGTYSGSFGFSASSSAYQLEQGHTYTQDVYKGIFFNDSGTGFLHESSCVCFGITDTREGSGSANGYCELTDMDNDKVFLVWKGTVDPEVGFKGDFKWTGGTGKYAGIEGNNSFQAVLIGSTSQGRGLWKGEWKLP
ncbi:MAG: hypothetical protein GWN84_17935 [Gammaproteobacteria bacterium]|nr:hypothetical protein [Gammaproteobacteria bacterium]NIR82534.1 hypothetical protein [Gammaproteobacteria bacterium]NIR88360.1 hypothetical protein [Gammaproteobacteria bacterium]NIU03672.1 hypothetical protein [Gammaproteobacteria bacterium]NIV52886.1 hypothetical protein [Gammaproteobacteria bacterium]